MIHRTFRTLDQPPKLVGFTLKQWAALLAGAAVMFGLVELTHLPGKAAISLCVFVLGVPAVLAYVSESGGPQLGLLLRELLRWRIGSKRLADACSGERHPRARGLIVLASAARATPDRHDAAEPNIARVQDDASELWR